MSGGFFRGTTADQDTRFSNKQAKLMKSQKFAPELEHLVDITKVKMDVIRPWIAQRVTELLGFEDDVLINFIYGLLDGKVVNGKEIQISLTGFMEKNTGKFMKELWILLLSAEKNMSGVPQQFLDAKEEETRKKKAETDRISTEIQRRKEEEGRKREQEKADKMDDKVDNSVRANNDASEQNVRHHPRSAADEKETNGRNSSRGRSRVSRSPQSVERSRSPPRGTRSRSNSRSFSNSRSYSDGRHRSRSVSRSPLNRRRSMTPRRRDSRTPRRSLSPVRRLVRSPMRRRSRSPPRRRYRTPPRRRSRTPPLRRSRAPLRRWPPSPLGYRSRSPLHYRSRSPIRRRSRSPVHHRYRSPVQRRSPSPLRRRYRRSPSSPRHRSPSPVRRKLATPSRRRSPTPPRRSSPGDLGSRSPIHRSPHSPVHRRSLNRRRSPMPSPRDRVRTLEKHSPRQAPRVENFERPTKSRKESSLESRKLPSLSPSPYDAPFGSESPPAPTEKNLKEDRSSPSPVRLTREPMVHGSRPSPPQKSIVRKRVTGSPQEEEAMVARDDKDRKSSEKKHIHSSASEVLKDSVQKVHYKEGNQSFRDNVEFRKKDQQEKREPRPEKVPHSQVSEQVSPTTYKGTPPGEGFRESYGGEVRSRPISVKGAARHTSETLSKLSRKAEELIDRRGPIDSDSEATPKHRAEVSEKRKHKRAKREESDYDSYDSQVEGRKESKRRRKEEKRLRKEERRRRREERRRKKEQRRAEKIKVSPPSDQENHDGSSSDGEHVARRDPHSSDIDEESEKKKLEIALREKALETLRAKKGGAGR